MARIAEPPETELKDTDVTCEEPRGAVSESGMFALAVARLSHHR
jgi:hypothetical protein